MQQHRIIELGDATLECTLCGSGAPVVLLANAGCSTGYFDQLARTLVTGGFQTISINIRGVGGSRGSLDGATLHDLAGDVAGVIKAIGRGPAHLVGHAFGNRIARFSIAARVKLRPDYLMPSPFCAPANDATRGSCFSSRSAQAAS